VTTSATRSIERAKLIAMQSDAKTPAAYIAELPPERQAPMKAIRKVIRANVPNGFQELMDFGMITWAVPLKRYPDTYNGHPLGLVALGNQKNHMALYLSGIYGNTKERAWFEKAWKATGKKLDMGKSCVRFKRLDDVPLDVVAQAVARVSVDDYIRAYEASRRKA
jgi:hypothetical protein